MTHLIGICKLLSLQQYKTTLFDRSSSPFISNHISNGYFGIFYSLVLTWALYIQQHLITLQFNFKFKKMENGFQPQTLCFSLSENENYGSMTKLPQSQFIFSNSTLQNNFPPKTKKIKKLKEIPKRKDEEQRQPVNKWTEEDELDYFCAVIKFSIRYSYHNLSWGQWKKNRFYNFVSEHFASIDRANGVRTPKQCKAKDQNLKKRYYQVKESMDLLEISEIMVKKEHQRLQKHQKSNKINAKDRARILRYSEVLQEIIEFEKTNQFPKSYEKQLANLMHYNIEVNDQIQKLVRTMK